MSYHVELLDQNRLVTAATRTELSVVADVFLEQLLDISLVGLRRQYLLLLVPGSGNNLAGSRPLIYRSPAVGYMRVTCWAGYKVIYNHPHTIGEVLEPGIRRWLLTLDRSETITGYRLAGPMITGRELRATPEIERVVEIEPYATGEGPSFRIRPLPLPELPPRNLLRLGKQLVVTDTSRERQTTSVKVLLEPAIQDELTWSRPFSTDVEQGGFLIGNVYQDEDAPGTHIVHITEAPPAEQTGASLLHFTFSGDSFNRIRQTIHSRKPSRQILGWYHTHLFPATDEAGLSSIDFRLHFTTFRIPWQVAGLVNLGASGRVLRFYVRSGDAMVRCPVYQATVGQGTGNS